MHNRQFRRWLLVAVFTTAEGNKNSRFPGKPRVCVCVCARTHISPSTLPRKVLVIHRPPFSSATTAENIIFIVIGSRGLVAWQDMGQWHDISILFGTYIHWKTLPFTSIDFLSHHTPSCGVSELLVFWSGSLWWPTAANWVDPLCPVFFRYTGTWRRCSLDQGGFWTCVCVCAFVRAILVRCGGSLPSWRRYLLCNTAASGRRKCAIEFYWKSLLIRSIRRLRGSGRVYNLLELVWCSCDRLAFVWYIA